MQCPQLSAALQDRLAAGSVTLQLHLWSSCSYSDPTPVHCNTGQMAVPTAQCCSARQACSRQCDTAVTPVDICCSYRCAMSQHQCTATLLRAKCSQCPDSSVLLYTYAFADRLAAGSVTLQSHLWICCSFAVPNIDTATLLRVCMQDRLAAGSVTLHTYGYLLFIQVCSQHQCTATLLRAKCSPHSSVLLCKTGLQQAV